MHAIGEAIAAEMERDPTVLLIGEDVAGGSGAPGGPESVGGIMGVTKGLYTKYPGRIIDTPISESALVLNRYQREERREKALSTALSAIFGGEAREIYRERLEAGAYFFLLDGRDIGGGPRVPGGPGRPVPRGGGAAREEGICPFRNGCLY